jgi:hypothetical protein
VRDFSRLSKLQRFMRVGKLGSNVQNLHIANLGHPLEKTEGKRERPDWLINALRGTSDDFLLARADQQQKNREDL